MSFRTLKDFKATGFAQYKDYYQIVRDGRCFWKGRKHLGNRLLKITAVG
jgi:hypothetical protein